MKTAEKLTVTGLIIALAMAITMGSLHGAVDKLGKVTAPPKDIVKSLKLDPFYQKYINACGVAVVSSDKVSDYAMLEAAYLIGKMLEDRPDIGKAMAANKVRMVIMGVNEFTADVPEHSDLKPKGFWDKRARGLGATPYRPATSCGEENLLRYKGDPYIQENILIHEFAHAIHHMGLNTIDKTFDKRLNEAYKSAMKKGLWKGKAGRWKQWRIAKYDKETTWRLYDIQKDPAEKTDLAEKHPEVLDKLAKMYDTWIGQMPKPARSVRPPEHLRPHTRNGNHARRPFGRGWMTVEKWNKIKDDPTQWSEMHIRKKMLQSQTDAAQ